METNGRKPKSSCEISAKREKIENNTCKKIYRGRSTVLMKDGNGSRTVNESVSKRAHYREKVCEL